MHRPIPLMSWAEHAARGEKGAPGKYPGQVVEVKNPAMIKNGVKNHEAIKTTLDRGLKELTGAPHAVDAWRTFFEPGDVVGIKVVPNGQPYAHSSFELVLEVIEGLKSAGVKTSDMFVYDRYRGEFMQAGYQKILPDGHSLGRADGRGRQPVPARLSRRSATTRSPATTTTRSSGWTWSPMATTPRTIASIAPTWASSSPRW